MEQYGQGNSNNMTMTVPHFIELCHQLPFLAFPGSTSPDDLDQQKLYLDQQKLEFCYSHRQLALPGKRWEFKSVASFLIPKKFEDTGVLQCRFEIIDVSGIIHNVPAGRWQVELLLFTASSPLWNDMDWDIYVTENGGDETEDVLLHFQTGRTEGVAIDAGHWFRFFMGTITMPASGGSVRLRMRHRTTTNVVRVTTVQFGGFLLRPSSVDWKREALLLRMLRPSLKNLNEEKRDDSPLYQLPKDVVVHIARYLITPLPKETLLIGNRSWIYNEDVSSNDVLGWRKF